MNKLCLSCHMDTKRGLKCSECNGQFCPNCLKNVLLESLGETVRRPMCYSCVMRFKSIIDFNKQKNSISQIEHSEHLKKQKQQIDNLDIISIHHTIDMSSENREIIFFANDEPITRYINHSSEKINVPAILSLIYKQSKQIDRQSEQMHDLQKKLDKLIDIIENAPGSLEFVKTSEHFIEQQSSL